MAEFWRPRIWETPANPDPCWTIDGGMVDLLNLCVRVVGLYLDLYGIIAVGLKVLALCTGRLT